MISTDFQPSVFNRIKLTQLENVTLKPQVGTVKNKKNKIAPYIGVVAASSALGSLNGIFKEINPFTILTTTIVEEKPKWRTKLAILIGHEASSPDDSDSFLKEIVEIRREDPKWNEKINEIFHKFANQTPDSLHIQDIVPVDDIEITPPEVFKQSLVLRRFQKIIDPIDEKVFSVIEKFPKGKKLVNYMRDSDSSLKPLFKNKRLPLHGLNSLYYDKTLMLKGAGFTGVLALAGIGVFKGIQHIIKNTKT